MKPEFTRDRAGEITAVKFGDHITVGYDPDDNEIEEEIAVEVSLSPAESDIGHPGSIDVENITYAATGDAVEPRLLTRGMKEDWEVQAATLADEFLDGERDAADNARLQARKDGA